MTFRVLDAGDPVQGAKVTVAGAGATAKIGLGPLRRATRLTATATKSGYVAGKAKLRALSGLRVGR